MGITRAEFLRLLPVAIGNSDYRIEDERAAGEHEGRAWSITFVEKPPRRIAQIALPVLEVTIALPNASEHEHATFVERFLRAYQRAGG